MTTDPSSPLGRVRAVLDRLLDPEQGCPWDREQTPQSLGLYLLEEIYELLAAVESGDPAAVKEELADCLFLLLFLTRLCQDQGGFDLDEVLEYAAEKMISRHPHVFQEGPALEAADEVRAQWHELKKKEKDKDSLLAGVPLALPALLRAHRLTERAARVGFDWPGPGQVLVSLEKELGELKAVLEGADQDEAAELGDVLFTVVNLARHLRVNAEEALRRANGRFVARFRYLEQALAAQGRTLEETPLAEMDRLWAEAKARGL